jgi:hypothetical protein
MEKSIYCVYAPRSFMLSRYRIAMCVCVCVCVCLCEMANVTGVYCFKNNPSCKAENSESYTRECITRSGRCTLPHAGLPTLLI